MRLLCDEMLAGLARWLRAAGYDTVLAASGTPDAALVAEAGREGRILLTRDRALAKTQGALLLPASLDEQAALLAGIGIDWSKAPFTRCLVDNAELRPATAVQVAGLPGATAALPGPFCACPVCGRVYWPGSHARRMLATLRRFGSAQASNGRNHAAAKALPPASGEQRQDKERDDARQ